MNTPGSKKGSARRLRGATITWLGERLGADLLPFAVAVTLHLARAEEEPETEVAHRVAELLTDPSGAGAAARLAADPATLASFFQNADLLAREGGDAVSLLVMEALEILDRPE